MNLTGNGQDVLVIEPLHFRVQFADWLKIGEGEFFAVICDSVTKAIQHTAAIQFLIEAVQKLFLDIRAMNRGQAVPCVFLSVLDKLKKNCSIKSKGPVKYRRIALYIPATLNQALLDIFFKSFFVCY